MSNLEGPAQASKPQSFADDVKLRLGEQTFHGPMLRLGRTPAVLRMLGFPDQQLRLPPRVLKKISTGKDGDRAVLDAIQIALLPELIDEAIAVFDSATVPGALVVLTRAKNADGHVVVTLEPNGRDGNAAVNLVTSAYGKQHIEWMEKQAKEGRLRYLQKNKGFDTLEVCSLTLYRETEPGSRNPQGKSVLGHDDLCKYRAEQRRNAVA